MLFYFQSAGYMATKRVGFFVFPCEKGGQRILIRKRKELYFLNETSPFELLSA
jgi:hypothetical protein